MAFSDFHEHVSAMPKRMGQDLTSLDAPRRALLNAVAASGLDLANLSRQIGRNHAYLGQYLWRGTPRSLDEDDRKALAGILKITQEELKTGSKPGGDEKGVDNHQSSVAGRNDQGLAFQPGAQTVSQWPKDVKILGYVKAGTDGFFLDQGGHHGMAYRPPALMGVEDAFAVRVHDESMVPAFKPGRIVWVHPTRTPFPGDDIVIEMIDGQAFLKELVRRTDKHVTCRQWRPEKEIKFERAKIKNMYYVVGSYKED